MNSMSPFQESVTSAEMILRNWRNGLFRAHNPPELFHTHAWSRYGRLTMALVFNFLVVEAFSATGLNADGIALLDFKKAITSDPQNALGNWNGGSDATPCIWNGISCKFIPGLREDRVVGITLPRSALGGTLTPSLGNLAYLETLTLDGNQLNGRIPGELFKAVNISRLILSNNLLTGDLPAEIRNVSHQLRVLEVFGNRLTSLPDSLDSCSNLQRLLLNNNNFTGPLPIGGGSNWTLLERLDLSVNNFCGTIPVDFGDLKALKGALNLSSNHLSGSVPPSLATLQEVFIDFSHNNLSGVIPSNSYFTSLGEPAFAGNPSLCGPPLKIACPISPSSAPSPSPSPSAGTSYSTTQASSRHPSEAVVLRISVGCAAAAILLMATVVFYLVLRKLALARKNLPRSDSALLRGCLCSWRENSSLSGRFSGEEEEEHEKLVHFSGVLGFSSEELLRGSAYVLGKGGVGIVYKAVLEEGTVVVVRRLGGGGEKRLKEFHAEVKSIAQVRHPNVVALHSFSWTADEKLLIYEYLCNGSLEMALYGRPDRSKGFLTWEARLRIARGVAQGIAHIHECSSKNYVHGDIKPANILLDDFLEARVADFGLQRLLALAEPESLKDVGCRRGDNGTRVPSPGSLRRTTSPRGDLMVAPFRMGVYHAPEVANTKRLTQKGDVYSFGVVLLELLTGRSPFQQLAAGELDLVSWMRVALYEKKALSEIFDPCLLASSNEQKKMVETLQVALACIAANPDTRPKMKQVAELIEALVSS